MFETPASVATLRLSLGVLVVSALSAVWETLAQQAPGSFFYLGMLPGPIQSLREGTFVLGAVLFFVSQLLPRAYPEGSARGVLFALYLGSACVVGSSLYGAVTGLHGQQLNDLRADALPLFVIKHAGYLDVIATALTVGWKTLKTPT